MEKQKNAVGRRKEAVTRVFLSKGDGKIIINGMSKELVGQLAAKIRSVRPVEPYQGKGIRYLGEVVTKKVGKSAAKK